MQHVLKNTRMNHDGRANSTNYGTPWYGCALLKTVLLYYWNAVLKALTFSDLPSLRTSRTLCNEAWASVVLVTQQINKSKADVSKL